MAQTKGEGPGVVLLIRVGSVLAPIVYIIADMPYEVLTVDLRGGGHIIISVYLVCLSALCVCLEAFLKRLWMDFSQSLMSVGWCLCSN